MKLTIGERIVLASLLPIEDSYAGMTEIQRLRIHLGLTGEEAEKIDMKREGGGIVWNEEKASQLIKDIPMGEWITNVIRDILRLRSDQRKIHAEEMTLYEKFVIDYGMV